VANLLNPTLFPKPLPINPRSDCTHPSLFFLISSLLSYHTYTNTTSRFGFHQSSTLDSLLEKEDLNLSELLDEEELLQECKAHNSKLLDFLVSNVSLLLDNIISGSTSESDMKHAYYACEIVCCEVYQICDALVAHPTALDSLWDAIQALPTGSNAPKIQYFSKVNIVLFDKKPSEMFYFLKNRPGAVNMLLAHLKNSAVTDLLIKLISVEDLPDAKGIVAWLGQENFITELVDRLNPSAYDAEVYFSFLMEIDA
jgi:serine/threonine-protein phosphatase 6 regulatory subunit 3